MKKAICFALYGTKDLEAKERWRRMEEQLQILHAPLPVYFLYLSEDQEDSLMMELEKEQITELKMVSLLLEHGRTYRKLEEASSRFTSRDRKVTVTPPLLEAEGALDEIASSFSQKEVQTLLVLHGKHNQTDKAATELNQLLPPSVRAISLEGRPGIQETIGNWGKGETEVYPLMILGGTHLKNDILSEEATSLFSRLSTLGFQPTLSKDAFGESPLLLRLVQLASEEKL